MKPKPLSHAQTVTTTTAAALVVDYLHALGVEYVFGVPGGAIEPLYDALALAMRHGGPRPVLARHETGAAFMADGYAREAGRLGVCCATSGPGATNLLTGVACAFDNDVPLLVLTGQPALPLFGRGALQESACTGVDVVSMFKHCTRFNTLVSHADQLEHKLVSALMHALRTPRGPAHLSLPVDLMRSAVRARWTPSALESLMVATHPVDRGALDLLATSIRDSRNMAMIVGAECACAIDLIMRFATATQTRFVTTPDAKGLIHPRHPLYRGVFGFAGHASAHEVLAEDLDLILAVGTSMGEWTSGAWSDHVLNNRLVHIDTSDEHLMRSPMARQHVLGDLRCVFDHLLATGCAPRSHHSRFSPLGAAAAPDSVEIDHAASTVADCAPIKPQWLMAELSQRFPETTRFLADAGNSTAWAIHYLELQDRRALTAQDTLGDSSATMAPRLDLAQRRGDAGWLRVLMDFAPMGWAIGAAVGTARARTHLPVVCITGDGSFLMNGQEITVAAQESLSVVFVVLNDAALGMVKHGQRLAGAQAIAFELPRVDYAMMARAMGIASHVIETLADFRALDMDTILARRGPTLLDVRIDGEEVPPMGLRMKTLDTKCP